MDKKDMANHFDVTGGSFDGVKVCELAGIYLLNNLHRFVNNDSVGLYREDGLLVIDNYSGPQRDRLRKDIVKLFKDNGFQITIETNLKIVDFLDAQLDLANKR